ncbi:MAG: carboxymuconolactone decarboxylase family protein [Gammaproteobacteria bacterium]|nr:carboxymuconolactone decarboxylase family protein [Gammaproteobacteria bacterium]
MPRLRQVNREDAPESVRHMYGFLFGDRDPVAEPGTATGTPGNWWTVFALVPDCFNHAVDGFRLYQSPKRMLDAKLRELGQTRAGYVRGSHFVFSQHCKSMRSLDFTEEQIEAIPHWQAADCFSELERLILAYADCLVRESGRTPDGLFDALKSHLSDEEILEFTYVTCMYDMHATMCRALKLEYDNVEERIAEIPAPDDYEGNIIPGVDE